MEKLLNVKAYFDFLYNFDGNVSHHEKNWGRDGKKMYIVRHVKYPLFLSDFNET
jgi:hypothetical protein